MLDPWMRPATGRTEPRYPIRVAAHRSGITPDTLRAWERRHGAVQPGRTDTDRRLYSDADIDRLRLLRHLVAAGHSISGIAGLSDAELHALQDRDAGAALISRADEAAELLRARPHPAVARAIVATRALDHARLRRTLLRAMVELGPVPFTERVLRPLCESVGDLWAEDSITAAHEHLASVAILGALHGAFAALGEETDGPRAVLTTPAGERHEIGALMAAIAAAAAGWRVLYLGPDLPAADIGTVAHQVHADAVLLSIVAQHGRPMDQELRRIRDAVGGDRPIIVGGAGASYHGTTLAAIGARVLDDVAKLRPVLAELAGQPA